MTSVSEQKPGGPVLGRSEVRGRRVIEEESDEGGPNCIGPQGTLCEMPSFGRCSAEKGHDLINVINELLRQLC